MSALPPQKKKPERKIHLTLFSFGSELVLKRAKLKMNRIHSGGFKRWVGEGGILSISFPGWPSLLIRGSAASVQLLCSAGIQSACVVPQSVPVLEIEQSEWTVSTAYWWLIFSSPDTPNCKRISMNFHIDSEWIRGLPWLDELHNMNVIGSKQCVG